MKSSKIIMQDFSKKQQEFFFLIDLFTYMHMQETTQINDKKTTTI